MSQTINYYCKTTLSFAAFGGNQSPHIFGVSQRNPEANTNSIKKTIVPDCRWMTVVAWAAIPRWISLAFSCRVILRVVHSDAGKSKKYARVESTSSVCHVLPSAHTVPCHKPSMLTSSTVGNGMSSKITPGLAPDDVTVKLWGSFENAGNCWENEIRKPVSCSLATFSKSGVHKAE